MEWLADPQAWVALLTLTVLEIVLGIDNVIFISILAGKLPQKDQKKARNIGLGGALITRILLLLSLAWIVKLTAPLFHVMGHAISGPRPPAAPDSLRAERCARGASGRSRSAARRY